MKDLILEVRCVSCGEDLTPAQTDMNLFRLGLPVHLESLKPECIGRLEERLLQKDEWITEPPKSSP